MATEHDPDDRTGDGSAGDFAGEHREEPEVEPDVDLADAPEETEVAPAGDVVPFPDPAPAGRVLTMRQHKILQVIRDSVERRGYPPSVGRSDRPPV